jgi:hypothetical protein
MGQSLNKAFDYVTSVLRQRRNQCLSIGIPCCLEDGQVLLQIGKFAVHKVERTQLGLGVIREAVEQVLLAVDGQLFHGVSCPVRRQKRTGPEGPVQVPDPDWLD